MCNPCAQKGMSFFLVCSLQPKSKLEPQQPLPSCGSQKAYSKALFRCFALKPFSRYSVCKFTTGVQVLSYMSCDTCGFQSSVTSFDVLNDMATSGLIQNVTAPPKCCKTHRNSKHERFQRIRGKNRKRGEFQELRSHTSRP